MIGSGISKQVLAPRRLLFGLPLVLSAGSLLPSPAQAGAGLEAAIRSFTGGSPVREGRVRIAIAELVENGNAVPVSIRVDSPMTEADHVRRIALFNERNPENDVIRVQLGPRAGRAELDTRIRLATSQRLVAIAETNDGRFWSAGVDVMVMLAACVE